MIISSRVNTILGYGYIWPWESKGSQSKGTTNSSMGGSLPIVGHCAKKGLDKC